MEQGLLKDEHVIYGSWMVRGHIISALSGSRCVRVLKVGEVFGLNTVIERCTCSSIRGGCQKYWRRGSEGVCHCRVRMTFAGIINKRGKEKLREASWRCYLSRGMPRSCSIERARVFMNANKRSSRGVHSSANDGKWGYGSNG